MSGLGFEDGATLSTDLSANFYAHFQTAKNDISSKLEALDASDSKPHSNGAEINTLSSDIVKLRKDLVDATPYLPTYDRGKCEQQLKALEESLSRHRAPKSKFAFKRKPAAPSAHPTPVSPQYTAPPTARPPASTLSTAPFTTNLTLSSRTSAYLSISSLVLPSATSTSASQMADLPRSSDITLTSLRGCIVNLFPTSSNDDGTALMITALHARSLHRVVLIIPPIDGSVLLHDVHDSIIVVGCHQFRMHDSANVTVLLHALSNPIIEGSHDIHFGAYPTDLQRSSSQSFFQRPSKHALAQDFDWIKPSPSPNWKLVDSSNSPGAEEPVAKVVRLVSEGIGNEDVGGVLEVILPTG